MMRIPFENTQYNEKSPVFFVRSSYRFNWGVKMLLQSQKWITIWGVIGLGVRKAALSFDGWMVVWVWKRQVK